MKCKPNKDLLQIGYYPFGMVMPGRSFSAFAAVKILKINRLLGSGESITAKINGSSVTLATYHSGYTITNYYNDIITSLSALSKTGTIEDNHLKITGWGINDKLTSDDEISAISSQKHYRFGFNGKEGDDEVNGECNSIDFGARIYDSRLGRWYSPDKIFKPMISNYEFAKNNPLNMIDPDGKDEYHFHFTYYRNLSTGLGSISADLVIVKTNGPDKFFVHNYVTTLNPNSIASKDQLRYTENTVQFYPFMDGVRSGATTSRIPFTTIEVRDNDFASLIKFANEFPGLQKYQTQRDPNQETEHDKKGWESLNTIRGTYNTLNIVKDGSEVVAGTLLVVDGILNMCSISTLGGASTETNILKNQTKGNAFRDDIAAMFEKAGYEVKKEVYRPTFLGPRYVDLEIYKDGKYLGGIECKTGNSPYTASQQSKDQILKWFDNLSTTVVRDK